MRAFTKPPSPLLIMKRSRRLLEFDKMGRPLHPLIDQGLPVSLANRQGQGTGDLGLWGASFIVEAMVCCKGEVLLVKDGAIWRFPGGGQRKGEGVDACARRVVYEEAFATQEKVLDDTKAKEVYSNMNNFDKRTTPNAWVETTIVKLNTKSKGLPGLSQEAEWFKKSELPKGIAKLHAIIITTRS